MTSKDLNLSFDQLPSAQPKRKRVRPPLRQVKDRPATSSSGNTIKMPERNLPRQQVASSRPLVAITLVLMMVNVLVLGAATYWLYAHFGPLPALLTSVDSGAEPNLERAAVTHQLAVLDRALGSRLDRIEAAIGAGRQPFSSTTPAIDEEPLSPLAEQGVGQINPTVADKAPATVRWVVNVGTFPDVKRAQELTQELVSKGHEARLADDIAGSDVAPLVQVAGFADRAAAEAAARQIMEQTKLNGLWVWKDG